jgi:hypothetical protein
MKYKNENLDVGYLSYVRRINKNSELIDKCLKSSVKANDNNNNILSIKGSLILNKSLSSKINTENKVNTKAVTNSNNLTTNTTANKEINESSITKTNSK